MWSVSWKNGETVECEFSAKAQRSLLLASLYALYQGHAEMGWKLNTPEEVIDELIPGNLFVFVGDKIMCLSETQPWFAAERVLNEEFIDAGISIETIHEVMRYVCGVVDTRRYCVGTRTAANQRHDGLAKLHRQQGLTVTTIELMGEIHGKQEDQKDAG